MPEEVSKEEKCRVAVSIAMDEIMNYCEGARDIVVQEIGEMFGLESEDIKSISNGYEDILKVGLTKERCEDFRGIRQWVMARAWELMEKEHKRFKDAIKEAWAEVKERCLRLGGVI
jgi:hypothetical protein